MRLETEPGLGADLLAHDAAGGGSHVQNLILALATHFIVLMPRTAPCWN